jgi:ribosomal protein S18 acetylase RimI-like enzyme
MIRLATPDDVDILVGLVHGAFGQYAAVVPQPSSLRETAESMAKRLTHQTAFVAEVAAVPVGCVFCYPDKPEVQEGDLYFGRLAVLPSHRRQGMARKLVGAVEQLGQVHGYKRVILEVRIAFMDNIHLFHTLGYEIYGHGTHPGFDEPTWYKMMKVV